MRDKRNEQTQERVGSRDYRSAFRLKTKVKKSNVMWAAEIWKWKWESCAWPGVSVSGERSCSRLKPRDF